MLKEKHSACAMRIIILRNLRIREIFQNVELFVCVLVDKVVKFGAWNLATDIDRQNKHDISKLRFIYRKHFAFIFVLIFPFFFLALFDVVSSKCEIQYVYVNMFHIWYEWLHRIFLSTFAFQCFIFFRNFSTQIRNSFTKKFLIPNHDRCFFLSTSPFFYGLNVSILNTWPHT